MDSVKGERSIDEIESAIEDYRERQRQRYLKHKNDTSHQNNSVNINRNDVLSLNKITKNNLISREFNKTNEVLKNKLNSSTSSSSGIDHTINNELIPQELERDSDNSLRPPDELCNEILITNTCDCPSQDAFNLENRNSRISSELNNTEMKKRNSKRAISSSGSGIFSSIRSWASSIVNHNSNRSESISPRSSRFHRYIHFNRRVTSGSGRSSQDHTNLNRNEPFAIYDENISDEELARRIQLEELSMANDLNSTSDRIDFPTLYSYGILHDNAYHTLRSSSSSNPEVAPFQGSPYNFDIKSSEDESNETFKSHLKKGNCDRSA